MNKIIFSCLLAVASAASEFSFPSSAPTVAQAPSLGGLAPQTYRGPPRPPPVQILRDDREGPDAVGTYSFNYESADGISRQEQGAPQGPDGAVASQGRWSFTFPDGTPGLFTFVADGNGYRVESDRLPVPPPLPAHAIAQIEKARLEDAAAASAANNNRFAAPPAPVPSTQYTLSGPTLAPQTVFLFQQ
ncbi:cuticle protein 2-like [Panulirus ornatus]|uniref:cuticle protein 2-like n=1 Tax=Panulirus ornatus TaxID=150431 RepID=UPI003A84651C